jgi:heme/copper-type cytochrome/quinol oxidase subunit 4
MTVSTPNQVENAEANTRYLVLAWATLMTLTALSWWLGAEHGVSPDLATAAILTIALAKVFVVGRSFMQVRHAAPILQALVAGWCAITYTALITIAI